MINKFRRQRRRLRRGLSTMEVALATGIMLPFAVALFYVAKQACGRLFQIIQSLVVWPYL